MSELTIRNPHNDLHHKFFCNGEVIQKFFYNDLRHSDLILLSSFIIRITIEISRDVLDFLCFCIFWNSVLDFDPCRETDGSYRV